MKMRLGIGIISFNNKLDDIEYLLDSVVAAAAETETIEVKFLCADNGDRVFALLDPNKFEVDLIPPLGNIGFSRMSNILMNRAFDALSCDAYLCLNPDGVVHRACISELAAVASRYPSAIVEGRQFPDEHPKDYDPVSLDTPWASGACLWIPRVVHETIGGFDERFFMYFEDVDFSWRARLAGFSIKFAVKALFAHDVINRPHNRQRVKMYLLSQRTLAHKWGADIHIKDAEQRMVAERFVQDASELEPLPKRTPRPAGCNEVVDLVPPYFAPARWQL